MIGQTLAIATAMVESITVPAGWVAAETDGDDPRHFSVSGYPDVVFGMFSREVSSLNHLAVCRALSLGEHRLSVRELESLAPVLGNMSDADAFALRLALVLELKGKPVVVVEGVYTANNHRCRTLLLRSSGNMIELIYYQAPADLFDSYAPVIDLAFKSIIWRH